MISKISLKYFSFSYNLFSALFSFPLKMVKVGGIVFRKAPAPELELELAHRSPSGGRSELIGVGAVPLRSDNLQIWSWSDNSGSYLRTAGAVTLATAQYFLRQSILFRTKGLFQRMGM